MGIPADTPIDIKSTGLYELDAAGQAKLSTESINYEVLRAGGKYYIRAWHRGHAVFAEIPNEVYRGLRHHLDAVMASLIAGLAKKEQSE